MLIAKATVGFKICFCWGMPKPWDAVGLINLHDFLFWVQAAFLASASLSSLESLPKAFAMFPTATLLHEQQHGRRGLRGAAGLSSEECCRPRATSIHD